MAFQSLDTLLESPDHEEHEVKEKKETLKAGMYLIMEKILKMFQEAKQSDLLYPYDDNKKTAKDLQIALDKLKP